MIGWKLRLWFKLILRRFKAIPSFCKVCGIRIRDFRVPDGVWNSVIGSSETRCWNCFSDACEGKTWWFELGGIDQAYYWRTGWQQGEKEADEDIAAGRVKQFDNVEDAVEWLEQEND